MVVRAAIVVALAIGVVATTVTLDAPAITRWSVPVGGTSTHQSEVIAQHLCSTIGNTITLARESYVPGAAIPTTVGAAHDWLSSTSVGIKTGIALPAVVCVMHTGQAIYNDEPLSPDVVVVIAGARSVKTYYLPALPTQSLVESAIPPLNVWF